MKLSNKVPRHRIDKRHRRLHPTTPSTTNRFSRCRSDAPDSKTCSAATTTGRLPATPRVASPSQRADQPDRRVTGWAFENIAQAWIQLMDRLGYERWVAQGGDWGALVGHAIGRLADPATLIGSHFNWSLADPAKLTELGGPTEEEQSYLARVQHARAAEVGYVIDQGTKSQTLGYGPADSPVGQLAWIVEKFKTWSDCGDDPGSSFTKDDLLPMALVSSHSSSPLRSTSTRPVVRRP